MNLCSLKIKRLLERKERGETKKRKEDIPGHPVVKNLPCSAGDVGSIPGPGAEISHATGRLSLHTTT